MTAPTLEERVALRKAEDDRIDHDIRECVHIIASCLTGRGDTYDWPDAVAKAERIIVERLTPARNLKIVEMKDGE